MPIDDSVLNHKFYSLIIKKTNGITIFRDQNDTFPEQKVGRNKTLYCQFNGPQIKATQGYLIAAKTKINGIISTL